MRFNSYNQGLTVGGTIISVDPGRQLFSVEARVGDTFAAIVARETNYQVLSNLHGVDRNRMPDPQGVARDDDNIVFNLQKYAVPDRPVYIRGIYQENGGGQRSRAKVSLDFPSASAGRSFRDAGELVRRVASRGAAVPLPPAGEVSSSVLMEV
jgi:hypothetical protein